MEMFHHFGELRSCGLTGMLFAAMFAFSLNKMIESAK